jgi:hypothetical protein
MADSIHKVEIHDRSVANILITSLFILCGVTVIFLLGIF